MNLSCFQTLVPHPPHPHPHLLLFRSFLRDLDMTLPPSAQTRAQADRASAPGIPRIQAH